MLVNQHFLLFPKCFLSFQKQNSFFKVTFILSSAKAFNLDWSKILWFGKELRMIGEFRPWSYFYGENIMLGLLCVV